ncbi:MAG: extracellular solute-binding protein [Sphaerochaetaceae bacterium]|nr:extracellular solute-binding protein [Sphaerochaetaceae bacterium]
MSKKLVIVLLVLVAAVSMVFASGSTEAKPEKLTVWSGYPEMEPFYKYVAEQFKQTHPNVEVEITTLSLREFEQKLAATIPSGTASDIFETSIAQSKIYSEAGLLPANPDYVNEFVEKEGRYGSLVMRDTVTNGKRYGVPIFQGRTALYYNKDYFAEAGITEPPKTFEEMYEMAKKLAVYDEKGNLVRSGHSLRLSGQGSGTAEKFWFVLYPMGATILEEGKVAGTYHAGYNNEGGYKALKYYIDAVFKDNWDDQRVKHDTEAFELGFTAMYFRESNVIGDIAQKVPDLNYGTATVPSDVRWGRITNINYLYVSNTCKNQELAWEYILLCNTDENQAWLLENVGWLPVRQDVDLSAVLEKQPAYAAFVYTDDTYEEFAPNPISCFDEIETKLAERIVAAFLDGSLLDNEAGMKKVLQDAADETNAILKRNNMYGE